MATNLVSLVMQFLTLDMIGRIGTALELDRNKIQPAVSSAVPALLAAFNDTATQPGGSQKLADAAREQDDSLRNFARVLATGGGQSSLLMRDRECSCRWWEVKAKMLLLRPLPILPV